MKYLDVQNDFLASDGTTPSTVGSQSLADVG